MKRVDITIINKLGLHARAAAKLVALASEFESEVWLVLGDKRIDSTSIMAVMMLAALPLKLEVLTRIVQSTRSLR